MTASNNDNNNNNIIIIIIIIIISISIIKKKTWPDSTCALWSAHVQSDRVCIFKGNNSSFTPVIIGIILTSLDTYQCTIREVELNKKGKTG